MNEDKKRNGKEIFVPDMKAVGAAIERTTHLGIGAHQDDLEFMALHGILECFQEREQWFGGIICTDGAGSARIGVYADYSDEQMKRVREREQQTAASIGQYAFVAQLGYPSKVAKQAELRDELVKELKELLEEAKPKVVYTHNPFDKHATHVGVFVAVVEAIRALPMEERPEQLIGCEVWRGLDWVPGGLKVVQKVDGHPNVAASLNGVFDSQIEGGKRYDLGVEGRRLANATFFDAHTVDEAKKVQYAVDLTALIDGRECAVADYMNEYLAAFAKEIGSMVDQCTRKD